MSVLLPFFPDQRSSVETVTGLQLPTVGVGELAAQSSTFWNWSNWYYVIYAVGVLMALWLFVSGVSKMLQLVRKAKMHLVNGQLVFRSDAAGPFSFMSIVHLPKALSGHQEKIIFNHELAHVKLGHSYDVLWLSLLRIVFWFNPLLKYYLHSVQEIHEYQADALTYISSSKEHYVKVQLDQLFQLPSDLSFANSFQNSNNLKKRIEMIYSEKTSKVGATRYFMVIPFVLIIGLIAACTDTPADAVQQEAEKVYKEADVMPEFPGGMQELMTYMGTSIQYPEAAKADGTEGKVFVQFVIDTDGTVGKVEVVKGVRDDLDSEAVRVISEMPKWTPGKKDGKDVRVQMVLPIAYKLS
jgi:TonB family protein